MYLDFGDAEVKAEGLPGRAGGKRTDSDEERREITEDATKRYQYLKKSSNILLPLLKFFNDDYVMFMVFMVASVVFSVLARKLVNNNTFIIRTISIAVSLVCSVPELIAVYYFAMLTMVKYPQYANILGVSVTLNDVYTSSVAVFLQNNPYMFYTFFIGVAVFAVLTITSIYSLITGRKTQQF